MSTKSFSIRSYVTLLTFVPLLIMTVSLEAFFLHDHFVELDRDLVTRGQLIARQLAVSSDYGVFSNNQEFLKKIADNALHQPDVSAVAILNAASKLMVASGQASFDLASTKSVRVKQWNELLARVNARTQRYDNGDTLLLYQPVESAQILLDDAEGVQTKQQTGAVIIEMQWRETNQLKARLLYSTVLLSALFLLLTLYVVHLASRRIVNPVRYLSDVVRAIGMGNLGARVTLPSCITELCTLANGINSMTAKLQDEHQILQQRIDEATEQLRNLAFFDALTLLPNRRLLNDRLIHAISSSARSGHYGALIFLDLDNFKPLNDQQGHAVGDLLLKEVAHRISACLREIDTVARFGGDEFVVMLSELSSNQNESIMSAYVIAEKIRTALEKAYLLTFHQDGQITTLEHRCTSSIGVVIFKGHEQDMDTILRCADEAMYQAKKEGRNRICFYAHPEIAMPALSHPEDS